MRGLVASGLVPAAAGLDGTRRRSHCRTVGPGAGPTQPRLLEVPQAAAAQPAGMEPQADLPGVQGHASELATCGETASAQTRARAALRAAAARYRVVGRLRVRRARLRPAFPYLQRGRRLQSRGAAY